MSKNKNNMENSKNYIPDKKFAIFLLRHGYAKKNEIKTFLKIKKKLEKTGNSKDPDEILKSANVFSSSKQNELVSFWKFLNARLYGIVLAKVAISAKAIKKSMFERTLITQRSLFMLKNKIVSLEELFIRKGILNSKQLNNIETKFRNLAFEDSMSFWDEALKHLETEDIEALQWREKHLKGIVGTKYQEKSWTEKGLLYFLKKDNKDDEEQEKIPPKSRGNKIEVIQEPIKSKIDDYPESIYRSGDTVVIKAPPKSKLINNYNDDNNKSELEYSNKSSEPQSKLQITEKDTEPQSKLEGDAKFLEVLPHNEGITKSDELRMDKDFRFTDIEKTSILDMEDFCSFNEKSKEKTY